MDVFVELRVYSLRLLWLIVSITFYEFSCVSDKRGAGLWPTSMSVLSLTRGSTYCAKLLFSARRE